MLSLIYDPSQQDYVIFSINEYNHPLHNKRIMLNTKFPPYKRLLCWRFKKALTMYRFALGYEAPSAIDAVDYSEAASLGGDDDDDDDDDDESTSELKSIV
jgi:hypothetical protein